MNLNKHPGMKDFLKHFICVLGADIDDLYGRDQLQILPFLVKCNRCSVRTSESLKTIYCQQQLRSIIPSLGTRLLQ